MRSDAVNDGEDRPQHDHSGPPQGMAENPDAKPIGLPALSKVTMLPETIARKADGCIPTKRLVKMQNHYILHI